MGSKTFSMVLPEEVYDELSNLADTYTSSQQTTLNRLNVQELLRLIVKAHLQKVRGPTKVENLRAKALSQVPFILRECPQCHLRVDRQDFPVLTGLNRKTANARCQVCGWVGMIND